MATQTEINEKLSEINKLIAPYQLAYVSPTADCIPLEKNAHYMDKEILDRLTENVERDGFLSQLPFAMKRSDGKFLILSGNHRLKASIKAKLNFILILYIEETDKDTQLSYQLSHNALVGKDDLKMLQEIYSEISTIEAKEFSGINDLDFKDLKEINSVSINDADIELTEMKLLFVESAKNEVRTILSILEEQKINENTYIVVGSFEEYIKVLTEVKKKYGIKSISIAFGKMIEICKKELEKEEKTE